MYGINYSCASDDDCPNLLNHLEGSKLVDQRQSNAIVDENAASLLEPRHSI